MSQIYKASSGGGGSGIQTIDGDIGSVTGSTVTVFANNASINSGSSVLFTATSPTTLELDVTDVNGNTLIGYASGNLTISGSDNTAIGEGSLSRLTSGNINSAIGIGALAALTTGNSNLGLGEGTGRNLVSGSENIYIGSLAGFSHTTSESFNIYFNTHGLIGESNALRIGDSTGTGSEKLSKAFICGINGVTLGGTPLMVTIDSSTNQLGVQAIPISASITIDGDTGSATGSTITLTALNGANNSGSSVQFSASGATVIFNVTDGNSNVLIGTNSGNATLSGSANTALGVNSLSSLTSGLENVSIGYTSFNSLTSGVCNVGVGIQTGSSITTGSYNIFHGTLGGAAYTLSDSSNISFNNQGNPGESNTLRMGSGTGTGNQQLVQAFISGINGNTLGGTPLAVTIDPATDQLGVQAFPSGSSVTINGDNGSLTGNPVTLKADQGSLNSGSTVRFDNSGTTSILSVTDSNRNTIIGNGSGVIGTSSVDNICIGQGSLTSLSSGSGQNVAIGDFILSSSVADTGNVAIGFGSYVYLNGGNHNTAIGSGSGNFLLSGSYNFYMGYQAGLNNNAAESSNLYVSNPGVTGESNAIRLGAGTGTGNQQANKTFISGINGVTLGGTPLMVTIDSSTDQLGVQAIPSGGSVTIAGDTGSISGSSLTLFANNASLNSGSSVLFSNTGTTSTFNVSDANNNTIVGQGSGNLTMTGTFNSALGKLCLPSVTSGSYNASIGYQSLNSLDAGDYNMAMGLQSLFSTTGGNRNTAIGATSLNTSSADSDNTAIGYASLTTLNGGEFNVAVGNLSGTALPTGSNNLFLGYAAGSNNNGGSSSNIYLNNDGLSAESHTLRIGQAQGTGTRALNKAFIYGINSNTVTSALMVTINSSTSQLGTASIPVVSITINGDTGSIAGSNLNIISNVASVNSGGSVTFTGASTTLTFNVTDAGSNTLIGKLAGNASHAGIENTALGASALHAITSGSNNIAIGSQALKVMTTGGDNVAVGEQALVAAVTGNSNVSIGTQTLKVLNGGGFNTAVGNLSLRSSVTDTNNTAVGASTMVSLNGGSSNTAIGFGSGSGVTSGSFNTYLGIESGQNSTGADSSDIYINNDGTPGESNVLRIGAGTGTGNEQLNKAFISGINGISVIGTAVLVSSSDQLGVLVSSRRFKDNIEDMGDYSSSILRLRPVTFNPKSSPEVLCPGLIAEEVAQIMPNLVVYDHNNEPQTVKYHEIPAMLLNELQKALARIEILESKLGK